MARSRSIDNIQTLKLAEEIAETMRPFHKSVTVKKQPNGKWKVILSGPRR